MSAGHRDRRLLRLTCSRDGNEAIRLGLFLHSSHFPWLWSKHQFVLNNISFDFWPISWVHAERMANFEEPNTSIIADCKILYVRSEDDLARFNKLLDKIAEMPQHGLKLVEKSEAQLRDAYLHLYKMGHPSNAESMNVCRYESQGVLTNVFYCLALLNRTYLTKGWGKNAEQILNFPLKPVHLEHLNFSRC